MECCNVSVTDNESYFLFLGHMYIKRLNIPESYVETDLRLGD